MKVRVLGCSGAIAKDCRTTSFLIDDSILIDAGTGPDAIGQAGFIGLPDASGEPHGRRECHIHRPKWPCFRA